jgi:hypothetical protein
MTRLLVGSEGQFREVEFWDGRSAGQDGIGNFGQDEVGTMSAVMSKSTAGAAGSACAEACRYSCGA